MKLKINESDYNHKKFNLITKDEYDYWFNIGLESFKRGDRCIPIHNKEFMDYMSKHSAKIGSIESKKTNQIGNAWTDGWNYGNINQPFK